MSVQAIVKYHERVMRHIGGHKLRCRRVLECSQLGRRQPVAVSRAAMHMGACPT